MNQFKSIFGPSVINTHCQWCHELTSYCTLQTHAPISSTHTHTHPFNGPFSGTTQVSQYQKGKTNLDFTEARDSEWQWHQLGHVQLSTSLQTDNHASTPLLSFLQAGCPSCRPTNSVKALKAVIIINNYRIIKTSFYSRLVAKGHNTAAPYRTKFRILPMGNSGHIWVWPQKGLFPMEDLGAA